MLRNLAITVFLACAVFGAGLPADSARSAPAPDPGPPGLSAAPETVVRLSTAWNVDAARPGDEVILAVVAEIAPGFHINADAAQEVPAGDFDPYETRIRVVEAHEGLSPRTVVFPEAHALTAEYAEGEIYGFAGRSVFYIPFEVEDSSDGSDTLAAVVEFEYQACDDVNCLFPLTETLRAALPFVASGASTEVRPGIFAGYAAAVAAVGPAAGAVAFDLFGLEFSIDASSRTGFLFLLLTAMLGGALLNFTPCVLPVIPIKIMGLAKAAGSRGRMFLLGFVMALGVTSFWLGLGALIAGVAGFTATNQLFQYPWFTITVGVIIAVMAVGMCGLFFFQLPRFVYRFNPSQESVPGSFGFGIMTAVLSTPCTAPFMGAAAAWAATQSAGTTHITFAAIGAGMAFPYLVLSASPDLVKKMPKSGPASELIKQVMGLLMLAAAAYFVGVGVSSMQNRAPDPPSTAYWWVVMAFLAAAGAWLVIRTIRITRRSGFRTVFVAVGVMILALAATGGARLTDDGPVDWVYYTPDRFEAALAGGKVVVMDFTAEWCLNCKSLEQGVLHSGQVAGVLASADVVPIKVDITGHNPAGKAKLKDVGRLTIPLLVVYSPAGEEVFKSDYYTVDQVLAAVARAR